MDKELEALMVAAKAAALAAHNAGYKIEWVSFQPEGDDKIEVGIRVSKDVMVSIVDPRACLHQEGHKVCGLRAGHDGAHFV